MASFFTFPYRWSPYQEMNLNLNLVGRETDLVGRDTGAPQRIWDSSIFTGRVGRYTMCCYVSPWEPPGFELPASPCGGESVAHSEASTGFCLWLTHAQWLGSVKAWACVQQHALPPSPTWLCMGRRAAVCPGLRSLLLSSRTPWRLPIGRRREPALKEKPVKEELK